MDLLDFFMPQPAQASHLRSIADSMRKQSAAAGKAQRSASRLEHDVGAVALVCMALVASLVEKGVISEADLQNHLKALDAMDTVDDNSLDPMVLRQRLGLKTPAVPTNRRPMPRLPKGRKPG